MSIRWQDQGCERDQSIIQCPLTDLAQVKLLAGDRWCQVSGGSGELEGIYLDSGLTNSQIQMSEIV